MHKLTKLKKVVDAGGFFLVVRSFQVSSIAE